VRSSWRKLFAHQAAAATGKPSGVLAPLDEALAALGEQPTLAQAKAWQPHLVDALTTLELPAWLICELLSDHNDLLYRLAIDEALARMRSAGWGDPPLGYAVLVMGSGGRHESLLCPDQDNALILEDYPPERHSEIDTWFCTLASAYTATLDGAGIPYCRGHVMGSQPLWRKPLSEWREQMRLWMGGRRVRLVQQCNILFDFAPVSGDAELATRLREAIFEQLPTAGLFLHEMQALFDESPVALDRFDRLLGSGRDAPHPHAINLKQQGLLPLTAALRLLALKQQCPLVGSRERLDWLAGQGVLDAGFARVMKAVFARLIDQLLRAQMNSWRSGARPDNWVDIGALSEAEREQLRQDLRRVRTLMQLARRH
jgi:CBS domain-containing protein